MSMPSSSDDVATRHGSSPALSSSSTTRRSSRASEPWWRARRCRLLGELVEAQREALGAAAVVDEDDRRAVLADQLEHLRVDRRPDRVARRLAAGQRIQRSSAVDCSGSTIDSTGTWILQVERLAHAGVDDRARAPRADHEAADLLQRVLRRAAGRCAGRRGRPARSAARASARGARRAWSSATAWISSTITASTSLEASRAPAGEHQVQRLGRRDEDVRRVAAHRRALASAACRRCGCATSTSRADPAQRRAQVALDVVGERLQRRDVDEPGARRRRRGSAAEAVEAPQERGQRLARAGRRAEISTCSPVAIAGHACACAAVGSAKAPREPVADAGAEGASGAISSRVRAPPPRPSGQRQRPGAEQHVVEHRLREPAGERVLLATGGSSRAAASAAPRRAAAPWPNRGRGRGDVARAGGSAASHANAPRQSDDAHVAAAAPARARVHGQAGRRARRRRLVGRRRAAHGGDDPRVVQLRPSSRVTRGRLVGEAGAVQRGEQEVARAVAGEDAAGAVARRARRARGRG